MNKNQYFGSRNDIKFLMISSVRYDIFRRGSVAEERQTGWPQAELFLNMNFEYQCIILTIKIVFFEPTIVRSLIMTNDR